MLRIVLVDDEPSCLEDLSLALAGKAEIVGLFTNALEAVERIRDIQPGAVFLDIEMPGMDGVAAASEILNHNPNIGIAFVTAHGEFALKAFEIDADDFVVKPFIPERLAITLQRLEKKLLLAPDGQVHLRDALHRQIVQNKPGRVGLWKDEHLVMVRASAIACCFVQKAQRKVTVIAEGITYSCSDSFNDFLEKINGSQLIRCHRSFALNPRYILAVTPGENNTMCVRVSGYKGAIPVSRQYSTAMRHILGMRTRNK